ncbi:hypothetical protein APHHGE2_0636 [Anaplasma phagocytophilum str. HGE2]|nr:hypothetical protein APHHGE2_0636 [Anaplasma phagocytophilum str. HGE2]
MPHKPYLGLTLLGHAQLPYRTSHTAIEEKHCCVMQWPMLSIQNSLLF